MKWKGDHSSVDGYLYSKQNGVAERHNRNGSVDDGACTIVELLLRGNFEECHLHFEPKYG